MNDLTISLLRRRADRAAELPARLRRLWSFRGGTAIALRERLPPPQLPPRPYEEEADT